MVKPTKYKPNNQNKNTALDEIFARPKVEGLKSALKQTQVNPIKAQREEFRKTAREVIEFGTETVVVRDSLL